MNRRQAIQTLALGAAAVPLAHATGLLATTAFAQATPAPPAAATTPAGPFTLPPLPYAFDALEPHLDAETMQIHHDKHHAAYVANLNKAVAGKPELEKQTVEQLLESLDKLPADVATAVRNHGGGHYNHTLLWNSLKRDGAKAPVSDLAAAIDRGWGSFAAFQDKFNAAAMSVFGSGWAWLAWDAKTGLAIVTTPNQDTPLSAGRVPLYGVDVWEHAYYVKFRNRRADYVAEFAKVVDWDFVSNQYRHVMKG